MNKLIECNSEAYIDDFMKLMWLSSNNGVFASEFIHAGTIICGADDILDSHQISGTINDLNFYPFMQKYEYCMIDNIEKYTNVKVVVIGKTQYIQAITDIQKDTELSRLYGVSFWFKDNILKDIRLYIEQCQIYHMILDNINSNKYIQVNDRLKYNDMSINIDQLTVSDSVEDGVYYTYFGPWCRNYYMEVIDRKIVRYASYGGDFNGCIYEMDNIYQIYEYRFRINEDIYINSITRNLYHENIENFRIDCETHSRNFKSLFQND